MKLDKIFSSHMVFAQGKPVRIYGTGESEVTVTFAEKTEKVFPENGKWLVEFPPMEYGGPYTLCVQADGEKIELQDIYVGKVFLIAGQSNIQFKLCNSDVPEEEYQTNDLVRVFSCDRIEKSDHFTSDDGWVRCKKEFAGYFSAIGYIMANAVQKRDGIAVGIVTCYQGASIIESWLPAGVYATLGVDIPLEKKHTDHVFGIYGAWNSREGLLYEFAFDQVVPFSFSAVIWYQGESDTTVDEAAIYDKALCRLIDIWREDLRDKNLCFVIVQIADFDPRRDEGWMALQKAQEKVPALRDNVSLVVSRDVCESNDIHPKNKTELSERIAKLI